MTEIERLFVELTNVAPKEWNVKMARKGPPGLNVHNSFLGPQKFFSRDTDWHPLTIQILEHLNSNDMNCMLESGEFPGGWEVQYGGSPTHVAGSLQEAALWLLVEHCRALKGAMVAA